MSLYARIAGSAALATEDETSAESGIYSFTADIFTANWVVRASMTSPEVRLSDYLNGSSPGIDVRPESASHPEDEMKMDLAGTSASVTKDCILMAIPVREPRREDDQPDNPEWRPMSQHRCWLALGPYRLLGTLHVEKGRDPRVALRMMGKQFVPVTQVSLTASNGQPQQYPVVFVNHSNLDLLAIKDN